MRGVARVVGTLGAMIALAGILAPAGGSTALGRQRVLAALVTFDGTRPVTQAVVRTIFAEANGFYRRSSFGRISLATTVTGWLPTHVAAPDCATGMAAIPTPLLDDLRATIAAGGYRIDDYARVVYVVSGTDCGFRGAERGTEAMVVDEPDVRVVVHELGHTFGLPHAGSASQCGTWCVTQEQGDPFSPMGSGFVDFSAYEKEQLGWIPRQPRVTRTGSYSVFPFKSHDLAHEALVVTMPEGDYWLEQRPDRRQPGLIVRFVSRELSSRQFVPPSTLLLSPVREGHLTVTPGQTFRVSGEFAVTVESGAATPLRLGVSLVAARH